MKSTLLKYKVGLVIVGLFVVGLVIFVAMQAGATKQDTATDKSANNIADKLNSYIETNNTVPSSLTVAGVHSAPATISYQKLSESSYKFCVTYKTTSSGFDTSSAVLDLATGSSVDSSSDSFNDNSELFLSDTHHKGANCQTIKPVGLENNNPVDVNPGGLNQPAPLSLCEFSTNSYAGCKIRCTTATQSNALSVTDDTISSVTTTSGTTTLNVTDTRGTSHVVTITPNTKLYDSSCQSISASDLLQNSRIRVIVAGETVSATQGPKVVASEIDDFSL